MKILIASCVFPPEPLVSAKTSFDLADYFCERGDDVTVVCSKPNRNIATKNVDYSDCNFKVKNLFTYASKKASLFSRFLENFTFGVSLFFYILFCQKKDCVYGNVWPLFSVTFLALACWIRGIKLIISVQDLYPESLELQGKVNKNSFLYNILLGIDSFAVRLSSHVIVISDSFKAAYMEKRDIKDSKISVIKNWQKSSGYICIDKEDAKQKLSLILNEDISKQFAFVYGGNVGVASGVVELVNIWVGCKMKSKLIIAGGGGLVPQVKSLIEASNCKNVTLLSPWLPEHTSLVYSAADVLILPIATGQESSSIPSKLMGYMLSKKPILMKSATVSPASLDLEAAGGGYIVNDFNSNIVNEMEIFFVGKTSEQLDKLGLNNYEFALKNYDSNVALKKIEMIVENLVR